MSKIQNPARPTYFATPAKFRSWLSRNSNKRMELWVGFRRKGSGQPSITWQESVDEALCYGWIDSVRNSLPALRAADGAP